MQKSKDFLPLLLLKSKAKKKAKVVRNELMYRTAVLYKIKDQDQTRLAVLGKRKIFSEIGAQVISQTPLTPPTF